VAAAVAADRSTPDPRLEAVERAVVSLKLTGDLAAVGLSAAGWLWLTAHGFAGSASGPVANGARAAGPAPVAWLQPVVAISGGTLLLLLLLACLLMAPTVNPFYAPPAGRRWLHAISTATFAGLAVTTVAALAVVAG
jgi:hypothetical protein